ncbi:hypothetical protein CONPUDRAFT_44690 [Coniophora puteana RWD-64-598 SS2]|uniref:HIT domain-containing protein n=1 Tax=Coniophora puteana (strain RWD-64-598) TaxID=741705 RepID=A0A5M3N5T3_CONPW|nr:uncharacterized protein CONPUDRAFT_44690 [Coniophora puteana RWD-64-598 SS2]EIW86434.1 hypothetical protein CONPUDRAFT_44690 [Coniophora puteana RWD-64-598 SS2]
MAFAPKTGCPMCGIVATAGSAQTPSPPESSARPQVLWRDDNFTAYRETVNPVSSKAHIIIALNLHVPSIYTLSSSDLPLLSNIRSLATHLLSSHSTSPEASTTTMSQPDESGMRIGFITPPFRDNKIPITDHLHAHAYILPADKLGWFRGVAYGPLAWYAIDDLIAEIRESVSNNRVKSGYENRRNAPIDTVPDAGARHGAPSGEEHTAPTLAVQDVESGQKVPQAA